MARRAAHALLLLALLTVPLLAGCLNNGSRGNGTDRMPPEDVTPPETWARFNEDNAWQWVLDQVYHPNGTERYRIPGTPGNHEVALMLVEALRALNWTAYLEPFSATYRCEEVHMHNVVAHLPGRNATTVILGAHYDTRPFADHDPDPAKRHLPVLGANDGASGVAVLMDVARILAARPNNLSYTIVFFDGEDGGGAHGHDGTTCDDPPWILGSQFHARNLTAAQVENTRVMLLLDMVGDKDLTFKREQASARYPHRKFQDLVWSTGKELGYPQFKDEVSVWVTDDHLPFQERRIPAVDIIHLDGEGNVFASTWHTTSDTPEHMSKDSLKAVGDTLVAVLAKLDRTR